ncbi:hypothetical protein JOF53_001019 [Crossiella equi]|uniref:Uncharacterized protein n=1 Tax=Crossiella equi TaxID=130796 RepID=A0ABS5A6D1_9PSEU|nr:hypothetical protein [Crossiella equi]
MIVGQWLESGEAALVLVRIAGRSALPGVDGGARP